MMKNHDLYTFIYANLKFTRNLDSNFPGFASVLKITSVSHQYTDFTLMLEILKLVFLWMKMIAPTVRECAKDSFAGMSQ